MSRKSTVNKSVAKGARPIINVKMSSYTAKGGYGVPPKICRFRLEPGAPIAIRLT